MKRVQLREEDSIESIRKILKKSIDGNYKIRLLVIERAISNPTMSIKEICEPYFICYNTYYRWVEWYNEGGLDKLKSGDGGKGNSNKEYHYKDEIFDELKKEIDDNQEQVWTLEKMQYFIKERFKIEPPTLQGIWYRLNKEYSYKSSRPYPKSAKRDELGRFKKTL